MARRPAVELAAASHADRGVLDNLAQFYQYDFSEFEGGDVGPDGKFHWVDWGEMFGQRANRSFLIRVAGELAGFVSVHESDSIRDRSQRVWWIDEFFVMRRYRRNGVGRHVARELFDTLPGTWEVGQVATNVDGRAFWRSVIDGYTQGAYEEFEMDDERWTGSLQSFTT